MSKTLGQVAYEAYGKVVGGKNFLGKPMPKFEELSILQKNGWEKVAEAIRKELLK